MKTPEPEAAIFDHAARLLPEERGAYLDQAAGRTGPLRQRIEALLRAAARAGDFLEESAVVKALPESLVAVPPAEKPSDRIGRYKLLQQIGEGGCGIVYMAEQEEPIRRRVAVKIIKLGMDTRQVIRRFEAERQALALMDHPNIAKVFDAGATETGRPFFAMELVRGVKITEFCNENHYSALQRLELFVQVCTAVQHAHQKGVIHRDLKPSNILVTVDDGKAIPKIIDFGIAKATQGRLTDKTLFTAFEQFIGTPAYMSPEQASLTSVDVDTRSDVYSLGVLLYELLTGLTPFETKELLAVGLDQMRRVIAEKEPARPSTRLSTMIVADLTTVARHRQTDPPRLVKLVSGDLDSIVMKALEKDRSRRYETASGLAADVQRFLKNEPVIARPAGNLYRLQKAVRRNRFAFASAAAVLTALVFGLAISTWEFVRERNARWRATAAEVAQVQLRKQAEARTYAVDMILASQSANQDANLSSVQALLAPWRHYQPDLRDWEWYYLNGLGHREVLSIPADTNGLGAVAWSPDGRRLAAGGNGGIISVWDATNGQALGQLRGHTNAVLAVAWSPDGSLLASGSRDNTVKIWDPIKAAELLTLRGHDEYVEGVAWSPDGKRLASGSRDRTVRVWDATTGTELQSIRSSQEVYSVAWDPTGTRIASGGGQYTLAEWDPATGVCLIELQAAGTPGSYRSVAWSPNGKWLATGEEESRAKIWDAATGTNKFTLTGHASTVMAVAWNADSTRLASASRSDDRIKVWDTTTGKPVQMFRTLTGNPRGVSWRPDGSQIAAAGNKGMISVFDVAGDDPTLVALAQPPRCTFLSWHPDGRLLVAADANHLIGVWDTRNHQRVVNLRGHTGWVWTAVWSPDGTRLASGSMDGELIVWDAASWKVTWRVQAHPECRSVAWSPDGKTIVSGGLKDYKLKLWDSTSGRLKSDLDLTLPSSLAVSWSPDGRQIAAGNQNNICIFDVQKGAILHTLRGHLDIVRCVAWSPDGRFIASASDDTTVKTWNPAEGMLIHTLSGHSGMVFSVAWHPTGTRLATGGTDHTVRIWNPMEGQELCTIDDANDHVESVAWSPDGARLASAGGGKSINIRDASPGHTIEELGTVATSKPRAAGH